MSDAGTASYICHRDDAFAAGMRVNISEWLYVVYEYLSLLMGGLRLIMCLINGSYC